MPDTGCQIRKLPLWLRRPLPASETYNRTDEILSSLGVETICTSANCPNRGECWGRGTAAVLILGSVCTRNCKFCSVRGGRPEPPDPSEPERLAEMARQMGLEYLVITSVNRDDLPDGGAGHFRDCINGVRQHNPDIKFEILVPDFRNYQAQALNILADALPFVFAHNVETVPSLYRKVRAGGDYQRSLNLLKMAKEPLRFAQGDSFGIQGDSFGIQGDSFGIQGDSFETVTKSSIMLGLGEADDEVEEVLKDLRNVGCDRITIGQYLKPSKDSLEVVEYVRPEKFDRWRQKAFSLGFSCCLSSPFARSSYLAGQQNSL